MLGVLPSLLLTYNIDPSLLLPILSLSLCLSYVFAVNLDPEFT